MFVTHTRPEPLLGAVRPLHTGAETVGLGYVSQGGALSTAGMLFVNRASWAHVVEAAARLIGVEPGAVLDEAERAALAGHASPEGVVIPAPGA